MIDETRIVDTPAAKAARKAEQERDGQAAMREYREEIEMARAKTERLRALRLAHEGGGAKPRLAKSASSRD